MKKMCILFVLLILTGCGAQPTFETIADPWVIAEAAQKKLEIKLPSNAAAAVLQSEENGELYLCDGYVLILQTFPGGDLDATMRQVTGFGKDRLTCMQTHMDGIDKYSCVWSSAGEAGDQVGRTVILDDGSYHYTVTVMADFMTAGDLTDIWQDLLNSATLIDTD